MPSACARMYMRVRSPSPRFLASVSSERWAMMKVEFLGHLVLGLDLAVADHPQPARDLAADHLVEIAVAEIGDGEEHLARGAAVDVHLLVVVAAGLDLDVDRREDARERGRRQQHAAEQLGRARIAALAIRPMSQIDGPLGIEIGGADQQEAAFGALLGHRRRKRSST